MDPFYVTGSGAAAHDGAVQLGFANAFVTAVPISPCASKIMTVPVAIPAWADCVSAANPMCAPLGSRLSDNV